MANPCVISIVIPVFNEAMGLAELLFKIQALKLDRSEVIVVDDGSTDATGSEAAEAGARVIRNDSPRGKGESLVLAWESARSKGYRWALCLDGDGQHDPVECPKFFSKAESTGAPLIVGNRMAQAQRMPWVRRQVNIWMSRRISNTLGQELPDTQCGFRLMNLVAWAALHVRASHFEIESEIICAFSRAGHEIHFVPIQVIYSDERSKIRPVRDTVRWFKWWSRRG
jgi:glycosyltransferase involved in cell wall biosynthesis